MIFRTLMIAICLSLVEGLGIPLTASALTPEQVHAVASQTTVVIAEGLSSGDTQERLGLEPGSGVIIARSGSAYFVLTAFHVVKLFGVAYGIRTSDGAVHTVEETDVVRLGRYDEACISICGMDLAVVKFNSEKAYPVASIGEPSRLAEGSPVFVSGWPDYEDFSAQRQRVTREGQVTHLGLIPSIDGGYSLLYSNNTQKGMSGGPVFDQQGRLVGIHGRGKGPENNCSEPELNAENSCAMEMFYFLATPEIRSLNLQFNREPITQNLIDQGLSQLNTADTISDIYESFTLTATDQRNQLDELKRQIEELEQRRQQGNP